MIKKYIYTSNETLFSDLELNLATKQYEAQVAECARKQHQIDKAIKGLKSFEEAQLVKEEWKGNCLIKVFAKELFC